MAQIEFYVGKESRSPIAVLHDGHVPRAGEYVSITKVMFKVERVTWAVDSPSVGLPTLRANVDLVEVEDQDAT